MDENQIVKLLELIEETAKSDKGTWQERRDEVRRIATENGLESSLEEFVSWFE